MAVNTMRSFIKSNGVLAGVLSLFLIIFIVAGACLCIELFVDDTNTAGADKTFGDEQITVDGKDYNLKSDVSTFLVMGLDKYSGDISKESFRNDMQADFLMLYVFDNLNKKYTVVNINRDTMTDVNILDVAGDKMYTEKKQIALAHIEGNGKNSSCRNTAEAVSSLLKGIHVDHYASLTLDSVAVFNDMVGGVEVEIKHDFTGVDDTLIMGERVTLMGEHALNFVKERHGVSNSTNAERMERQKEYLTALREKTLSVIKNNDKFIAEAVVKMADYIVSDRSVNQLQDLAEKVNEYEFLGSKEIKGESKMGKEFIEFYPDEKALEKLVIELFYTEAK